MDKEVTAKIAEQQAQTPPVKGLTHAEAETRLTKYGPNEIAEKHQSVLKKLLSYFWGPIPWMIEAAAILSGALGNWADLAIIIIMLGINAAVAFWQEHKAGDAIALLKARLAPEARVLRDGNWSQIPARELVPGDVVLLQIGNIVPADAKLIKGDYLSVDESALTGESLPVDKGLGDQAYSGAIVRQGEMTALITATGMNTYFGKTAQLVATAEVRSHFQRAVLKIGNFLILATAGLVVLILLVALFRQEPFLEVLQFALILTVAAIPVALPTVLSVTMAIGAERLAQMKAIVSRLVAIEELAGVDVLCADKTGTLTKNKLTLGDPLPVEGIAADDLPRSQVISHKYDTAFALLMMTLVIEFFVYPNAFDTHGIWAVCFLFLMKYGAGPLSLDAIIARFWSPSPAGKPMGICDCVWRTDPGLSGSCRSVAPEPCGNRQGLDQG
ncbi:MAG: HAD-IC family P-type ATPase, partial [Alphaproteobacteria bacterium]